VCRKNSRDGCSGIARLLKVGGKDAEGIGYDTPSSGEMPKASRGWGIPPPQPTRGSGEARKLPSGVRGRAPAKNEFGALWSCQKATGGNHFEYSDVDLGVT